MPTFDPEDVAAVREMIRREKAWRRLRLGLGLFAVGIALVVWLR